jgi:hypothetical protein
VTPPAIERIGRYEIRDVLGHGAMGVVYRAYDTVLERVVALKTHHANLGANENIRRRFAAEVKTSSRLSHPNIVTVYDGGIETDIPFIVMELVEGTTLEAVLAERGKLDAKYLLAILVPVGEALAYAHRQQVVHRDLKPANILIATSGQAKVTDFGVAKALGGTAPATTMVVGTPTHMAPEQIEGKPIDGRVDVFALGVVAYQALTGQVPFTGEQVLQIIHSVMHTEPPPPSSLDSSLPKAVDAIIAKAIAKDPAKRYADPEIFVHELRVALQSEPIPAVAVPKAAPPDEKPAARPRLVPWVAGAGALAAAAAAAVFALRSGDEQPSTPVAVAKAPPAVVAAAPTSPPAAPPTALPTVPPVPTEESAPAPAAVEPTVAPTRAATVAPERKPTRPPAASRAPGRDESAPASGAGDGDGHLSAGEFVTRLQPPSSRPAGLDVISDPAGSEVLVDGRSRGKTPLDLDDLDPGHHEVEVRATGYNNYKRSVDLQQGARSRIDVALVSSKSTLAIESVPPGAAVAVNGQPRGATPVEVRGLEPGSYEVSVQFSGGASQTRSVNVPGGGSRHTITFRLSQ